MDSGLLSDFPEARASGFDGKESIYGHAGSPNH